MLNTKEQTRRDCVPTTEVRSQIWHYNQGCMLEWGEDCQQPLEQLKLCELLQYWAISYRLAGLFIILDMDVRKGGKFCSVPDTEGSRNGYRLFQQDLVETRK